MAKSKVLITLIREIVRQEVQKEVKKIFIKEDIKHTSIIPKRKKPKEVSYTKDPTLNKILNETAQSQEFEEYPTMGDKTYTTSNMAEALGYGYSDEAKREIGAVQTAQAAGVNPENVPEEVMGALTKDYRGVMNALKERDDKK